MKVLKILAYIIASVVVLFVGAAFVAGLLETDNIESKPEIKTTTVALKVELPEPTRCTSDLGILRTDRKSGESTGKKTERTELKRLLERDCDIIEITYVLKPNNPNYSNTSKKVIYNKIERTLNDIYTKNNVIEEYNNVTAEALLDIIKKGESFYAIEESEYIFNNSEMTVRAVGKKPEQSEWDGSVKVVKDYIESNAHDASSVEYLEWSKVTDSDEFWIVRCKYKGSNALGGIITQNAWFYMQNKTVIEAKIIF